MTESIRDSRTELSGWKEIATHLGRSVRTVQRWERELDLPIRRVRALAGDLVYADPDEIAAWLVARSSAASSATEAESPSGVLAAAQPEVPSSVPRGGDTRGSGRDNARMRDPAPRWRSWRPAWMAAALCAVVATARTYERLHDPKGPPARWEVVHGALRVSDAAGRSLWSYGSDFPDVMKAPSTFFSGPGTDPVEFYDLDGDGRTEVLALPRGALPADLYCFESDGRLRFRHSVRATVRYGHSTYGPPWVSYAALVDRRDAGSLWVASLNTFFPSVVQKLSPRGQIAGEYWLAGHVNAMQTMELLGRQVLVIGSARNEDFGAAVSVLDAERPTGSARSDTDSYRCVGCPDAPPLAFLSLPRPEIGRIAGQRPRVVEIRRIPGGLMVLIQYVQPPAFPEADACAAAGAWYHMDEQLRIVKAEFVDNYIVCHAQLTRDGKIDHAFGRRDEADLFPVRVWRNGVPSRVDGPEEPTRITRSEPDP
jgi:hypothetical protein